MEDKERQVRDPTRDGHQQHRPFFTNQSNRSHSQPSVFEVTGSSSHPTPNPNRPSSSSSASSDTMLHYDRQQDREEHFRLPPLSSLGQYSSRESALERSSRGLSSLVPSQKSNSTGLRSSTSTSTLSSPPSVPTSSRAELFMSTLLRAAQPADEGEEISHCHSPMSVHSIVDSERHRPKKRRTSSSQEPLQSVEGRHPDTEGQQESTFDVHDPYADLHRHLALANPAAVLARASHKPFRPAPLQMSMSASSRRWQLRHEEGEDAGGGGGGAGLSELTWARRPHPSHPPVSFSTSLSSEERMGSPDVLPRHHYVYQRSPQGFREQAHSSASSSSYDYAQSASPQDRPLSGRSISSGSYPGRQGAYNVHGKCPNSSGGDEVSHMTTSIYGEEKRWSNQSPSERSSIIRDSILRAREDLLTRTSTLPSTHPTRSIVTTIRCLYANIAQKSYGSEKRFLCPPPRVKVIGPLRACRWASARVVPGDMPTPSSMMLRDDLASICPGEEDALLDSGREARFGKLHVGGQSDARLKTFRLQISLLRAETSAAASGQDASRRAIMGREAAMASPTITLPSKAWSTFHSSPISVISKPARKSIRTRAASPAISSGSLVCLYNRLNSQTVRTKYLAFETVSQSGTEAGARRIIARQDGWQSFSIQLLAKPVRQKATSGHADASRMTMAPVVEEGITYGSIVCLSDTSGQVHSDPMLVCKVDKGRVNVSDFIGGKQKGLMRFHIKGDDKTLSRQVLLGSGNSQALSTPRIDAREGKESAAQYRAGPSPKEEISPMPSPGIGHESKIPSESGSSIGGAVIQMQKVTLMRIAPRASATNSDEVEYDFNVTRSYLCSTAFERPDESSTGPAALARTSDCLRRRCLALQQDDPLADEKMKDTSGLEDSPSSSAGNTVPSAIGYAHPSRGLSDSTIASSHIDKLEDAFCWTVVTISQTEVSYIEANAQRPVNFPHPPASPFPITPYPLMAARPSYNRQNHVVVATVLDYLYNESQTSDPRTNLCASSAAHEHNLAHEIWLGHSGALLAKSTATGPYTSEVVLILPPIEQLLALHRDYLGATEQKMDYCVQLPILFVRANYGITFLSGYWLVGSPIQDEAPQLRTIEEMVWDWNIISQ